MVNSSSPFQFLFKHPPTPSTPAPTSFILGHISTSPLPDGRHLDMWILHTRDSKRIDVGSHITICRTSTDLANRNRKINPLPTAIITGVAYCNANQVVFRIQTSHPCYPSLLSMPLYATHIGILRKLWYKAQSSSLSPPPLPPTLRNKRAQPSNISEHLSI